MFIKEDRFQTSVVLMYITIIDLSHSLKILFNNSCFTAIGPVFRSLLEAQVELVNLEKDKNYCHRMAAADDEQWLKQLKEGKKGKNPYCSSLATLTNIDNEILKFENNVKIYKAKNCAPLSIANRFIRAGMEDEYRGLYNGLCSEGHNNLRALVDRHIEFHKDMKGFEVILHKKGFKDYEHIVTTTINILLRSGVTAHSLLKTSKKQIFNEELDNFLKNEQEYFT